MKNRKMGEKRENKKEQKTNKAGRSKRLGKGGVSVKNTLINY